MLGLWEVGSAPQRLSLHLAFRTDLDDLLRAAALLRGASLYFHDPDGNLIEFLAMLPDSPEPGPGVEDWSRSRRRPRA